MKFTKVVKAKQHKKYVIFENVVSENIKGYWDENGQLVSDINDADVFTNLELGKAAIQDAININKENGDTAEHYYAIREVVIEDLVPAVYQIKTNEIK